MHVILLSGLASANNHYRYEFAYYPWRDALDTTLDMELSKVTGSKVGLFLWILLLGSSTHRTDHWNIDVLLYYGK